MLHLAELPAIIMKHSKLFVGIFGSIIIMSLVVLNVVTPLYEARVVVTKRPDESTRSPIGNLGGNLSSLASVIGVSDNTPRQLEFTKYVELLTSRTISEILAREPELMHAVFEVRWDKKNEVWKVDKGFFAATKSAIKAVLALPPKSEPSADDLQLFLQKNLRLSEIRKTPFVEVSLRHKDSEFAEYLLNIIHTSLDHHLRERARQRVADGIEYLSNALTSAQNVVHVNALTMLILQQEQEMMMINQGQSYAVEIVEQVGSSKYPVAPRPVLVLIFGFIAACLVATSVVVLLELRRRAKANTFQTH